MPEPPPEVDRPAPELALKDQHGRTVSLADFQGTSNVALVFYPAAFSGICTGELCEIRDNLGIFEDGNVQVIGVSCDPLASQRAWAEDEGYDFPLLSDFWPHGEVSRRYGVFHPGRGFAVRGSFLIDKAGVLRWSVVNGPGLARPLSAYREAIAAL
jgi:mycoredoxin-dependent peroxiredoxin